MFRAKNPSRANLPVAQQQKIERIVRRVFTPQFVDKIRQRTFRWKKISTRWKSLLRKYNKLPTNFQSLLPLGAHSEGNKLLVFSNGSDAFSAMWDEISKVITKIN